MTRQEAEAAVKQYGSINKAARSVGVRKSTISNALKGITKAAGKLPTAKTAAAAVKRQGKTLNDFRQTYDKATIVPAKIKAALVVLGAGGWDYESQFARLAGVSLADLGTFRDQFADYVVALRDSRRAWAGSKATAKQMREML